MPDQPPLPSSSVSPPWPRTVKTIAAVTFLVLGALAFWRFFEFVQLFVLAALLAFILHPILAFLQRWVRLPRGVAVLVTYILFVVVIGGLGLLVGALVQTQIGGLINNVLETVRGITVFVEQLLVRLTNTTFQLGRFRLQLPPIQASQVLPQFYESLVSQASEFIGQGGSLVTGVAQTALVTLTRGIVMVVLSIYLLLDGPRIFAFLQKTAQQSGYGADAAILIEDFQSTWNTYFRGQMLLALIMGVLVSAALFALRVDNPLALGILAGVLELAPVLGQYLTMVIIVVLVYFQPEPAAGLQPWLYTLLVAVVLFGIQQIQGNVILPRIHGRTLALHPVLILLGVLMGASFAGVLGAILAPPLLATIKLFSVYIWRKMLDVPPFDDEEAQRQEPRETRSENG
ncbi:MAG TPA: AI-2E family transporter [Chloroflexi bacterium]|nr:AI-2E family transporter [Chloroflexota bacterium]